MYYTTNMQTGKQDRPVYQDGDVFQDKETGELFQLAMLPSSHPYTSKYILYNGKHSFSVWTSSLAMDYNCVGNIAPNHDINDFICGSIANMPFEQAKNIEPSLRELRDSRVELEEAQAKAEQLREQLRETEECVKRRAHHLTSVQASIYRLIQEIRETK